MLGIDSFLLCNSNFVFKTRRFSDIRLQKMSWPWNPGQRSLEAIGTDTDLSATYDFLLTLHSNREPISYRFRVSVENRQYSHPMYLTPPPNGFPLELGTNARGKKTRMMGLPDCQNSFKIG